MNNFPTGTLLIEAVMIIGTLGGMMGPSSDRARDGRSEVFRISLLDHGRDKEDSNGRSLGHGAAAGPRKDHADNDRGHPQSSPEVADKRIGKANHAGVRPRRSSIPRRT